MTKTQQLQKHMRSLNKERLWVRQKKRLLVIIPIGVIVGVTIGSNFVSMFGTFGTIVASMLVPLGIVGMMVYMIYHFAKIQPQIREFEHRYKKEIIECLFADMLQDFSYDPAGGIPSDYIKGLRVMKMGNRYRSEDLIKGSYQNVGFQRADVYIANESNDSDGDSHTTIYFEGQWQVFEFPKSFQADVQIVSKKYSYANKHKQSKLSSLFGSKKEDVPDRRQPIKTESEAFNQMFAVYATSETDAFYVLTPTVMEQITKLQTSFGCSLMLLFTDRELNVAVHNRIDSLQPNYHADVDTALEETMKQTEKELTYLTSFVDALQLDNTLYK